MDLIIGDLLSRSLKKDRIKTASKEESTDETPETFDISELFRKTAIRLGSNPSEIPYKNASSESFIKNASEEDSEIAYRFAEMLDKLAAVIDRKDISGIDKNLRDIFVEEDDDDDLHERLRLKEDYEGLAGMMGGM